MTTPPPLCNCSIKVCKVCIFDIDNTLTVGASHDNALCPVLPGRVPSWPSSQIGTTVSVR